VILSEIKKSTGIAIDTAKIPIAPRRPKPEACSKNLPEDFSFMGDFIFARNTDEISIFLWDY
jgi:hypothetical protein